MHEKTITIIGGGSMARAIVSGLCKQNYPASKIWITNPSENKLEYLKKTFSINVSQNNKEGALHGDVLIFAVKPFIIKETCAELKEIIEARRPILISIATGVRVDSIISWLNPHIQLIRAMPNTPAAIGFGAIGLYKHQNISRDVSLLCETIMQSMGVTVWVRHEKEMDLLTAFSGAGPAYVYLFMEAFIDAAKEQGMSHETATLLMKQTVLGAAKMAEISSDSVTKLREHVMSPGGATMAALEVFENQQFRNIVSEALKRGYHRAEEIAIESQE